MQITVYIQASWNRYTKEWDYSVMQHEDMTEFGYTCVHQEVVNFRSRTHEELTRAIVPALRAKKAKIYVDAEAAAQEVDKELDQLLSLENKTESNDAS